MFHRVIHHRQQIVPINIPQKLLIRHRAMQLIDINPRPPGIVDDLNLWLRIEIIISFIINLKPTIIIQFANNARSCDLRIKCHPMHPQIIFISRGNPSDMRAMIQNAPIIAAVTIDHKRIVFAAKLRAGQIHRKIADSQFDALPGIPFGISLRRVDNIQCAAGIILRCLKAIGARCSGNIIATC